MKKSFFSVSFAFALAAAVYAQGAPDKHWQKMPEPVSISGTVKIAEVDKHKVAFVLTDSGKEYVLLGVQGDEPAPQPPRPPKDDGRNAPPPPDGGKERPAAVKMDELAAVAGKKVTLTGFFPDFPQDAPAAKEKAAGSLGKDGAFMLTGYSAN